MGVGRGDRRVLVVEDEVLIGMDIAATLEEAGYEVVGPVPRLEPAVKAAAEERIDAAVLDVNLGGSLVFPVADALERRSVPFVFLTGYDREILPERFVRRPLARKPCAPPILLSLLRDAIRC